MAGAVTDSSEIEVRVFVPVVNETYPLWLSPGNTVGDIQKQIEQKLKNCGQGTLPFHEFALFGSTDKLIVNASPPITPNNLLFTLDLTDFTYDRAKIHVRVRTEYNNTEEVHTFDSHLTTARITKFLQPNDAAYELRLLTSTNNFGSKNTIGVKMNPHRTLRTYRLKETDVLVLQKEVTTSGIWRNVAGQEQVPVIISIPEPYNLSKAMKVLRTTSIKELKTLFLKKIYLNVPPSMYGIYAQFNGPNSPEDHLEDSMSLTIVHLPCPIRLSCKLLHRPKKRFFGVEPDSLTMIEDEGILVPEVLVFLKELLEANNGFTVEGLFRRSGSESMMKKLREDLESGLEISTKDVHSVATLIKRWFKELPVRLLVQPNIDLPTLGKDIGQKLNLQQLLPPLYARILTWIFVICLKLIDNHSTTKMDAKNLAIVWGPAIVAESAEVSLGASAFSAASLDLATTGYGVDIVENNLRYLSGNGISPLEQLAAAHSASPTPNTQEPVKHIDIEEPQVRPRTKARIKDKMKDKAKVLRKRSLPRSSPIVTSNSSGENTSPSRSRTNTVSGLKAPAPAHSMPVGTGGWKPAVKPPEKTGAATPVGPSAVLPIRPTFQPRNLPQPPFKSHLTDNTRSRRSGTVAGTSPYRESPPSSPSLSSLTQSSSKFSPTQRKYTTPNPIPPRQLAGRPPVPPRRNPT